MIESDISPQSSITGLKGMGGKKGKGSLKAGLFAKFLALFQKHMSKGGLGKGTQKGVQHIQNAQAVQKSQAMNKAMMGQQTATAVEPGQGLALMVHAPGLKAGEIKFASMEALQAWLQDHPDAVVVMEPDAGADDMVAEAFMAAMQEIGVENEVNFDDENISSGDSSADILVGLASVVRDNTSKVSNVISLAGEKVVAKDAHVDELFIGKQKNIQGEKAQVHDNTRQQNVQAAMQLDGKNISQVPSAEGKPQQLIANSAGLDPSINLGKAVKDVNQSAVEQKFVSASLAEKSSVKKVITDIAPQANVQRSEPSTTTSRLETIGKILASLDADPISNEKIDVKISNKTVQQVSEVEQIKSRRTVEGSTELPTHLAQLKADRVGVPQQLQGAQVMTAERSGIAIASDHGLGTSQQDLGSSQQDTSSQLLAESSKADAKSQRVADFAAQLAYKTPKSFRPADAMIEIARSARDGSVKIELQLDPAHLGKIQVTLQTDAAKQLQVHFVVDQAMSRQALEQNMPQLRQALADQGLDLGSFSMSMNSQGKDGDSQGSGRSGQQDDFASDMASGLMDTSKESVRMGINLASDGGLSVLA